MVEMTNCEIAPRVERPLNLCGLIKKLNFFYDLSNSPHLSRYGGVNQFVLKQ